MQGALCIHHRQTDTYNKALTMNKGITRQCTAHVYQPLHWGAHQT